MKIVINKCYGGFSLSKEVYEEMGLNYDGYGFAMDIERDDPKLVEAVEKVGLRNSSGSMADLEIVEIPDGVEWELDDYDGIESIHEKHRSW